MYIMHGMETAIHCMYIMHGMETGICISCKTVYLTPGIFLILSTVFPNSDDTFSKASMALHNVLLCPNKVLLAGDKRNKT